jgi:hypothetical protein
LSGAIAAGFSLIWISNAVTLHFAGKEEIAQSDFASSQLAADIPLVCAGDVKQNQIEAATNIPVIHCWLTERRYRI